MSRSLIVAATVRMQVSTTASRAHVAHRGHATAARSLIQEKRARASGVHCPDSQGTIEATISPLARGLGGRAFRERSARKVRAPRNSRCRVTPGRRFASEGQCHRKDSAGLRAGKVERVRQERTAVLATGSARQTPPGARPNRGGIWAWFRLAARVGCLRGGATRLLEEWPHSHRTSSVEVTDRTRLIGPLALLFVIARS